jgi:hypothetical protein
MRFEEQETAGKMAFATSPQAILPRDWAVATNHAGFLLAFNML